MTIDKDTFLEASIQLKLVSEGLLESATALRHVTGDEHADQHYWHRAIEGMAKSLGAVEYMEKLMTAVLHAQDLPMPSVGTA